MAREPRSLKSRGKLTLTIVGLLALLAVVAVVLSTGMQAVRGSANPTVAAADQATTARTEAKTGEGEARAENYIGR